MKWMIASDLHGSAYYTRLLLEAMDREQPDRLLLLGDLLYHGPGTICPGTTPPRRSSPCSILWRAGCSASAATARPRWTRWSWSSRCWRITA